MRDLDVHDWAKESFYITRTSSYNFLPEKPYVKSPSTPFTPSVKPCTSPLRLSTLFFLV